MQFFLTVPHDSAEEPTMASMDPAELGAALAAVEKFNTELHESGAFRFAGGLHPPSSAKTVDATDGEPVVVDGPFVEAPEYVGGFWVIEAADQMPRSGGRRRRRRRWVAGSRCALFRTRRAPDRTQIAVLSSRAVALRESRRWIVGRVTRPDVKHCLWAHGYRRTAEIFQHRERVLPAREHLVEFVHHVLEIPLHVDCSSVHARDATRGHAATLPAGGDGRAAQTEEAVAARRPVRQRAADPQDDRACL